MQSGGYNGGRGSGVPDFYPNGRSISFASAMNGHPYSSYPTYTQPQSPYSSLLRRRRLHHARDLACPSPQGPRLLTRLSLTHQLQRLFLSIPERQVNGFISETRVQPFAQGRKDRNLVNATLSAVNSFGDARMVRGIEVDRGRRTVSFNVKVLARIQFQNGWWRLRQRLLRVLCRGVAVSVSSNSGSGKLASGSRDCQVAV
ncbi:hypothetical protein COP1_044266 [Malus domestica]